MKRIQLLSLPDPRFPPGDPNYEPNRVDYRLVIEQVIRVPLDREKGTAVDEMRKGIRILDALDHTTFPTERCEVLELEDADWEFLKSKVEKFPWAGTDRRFLQFHDDITRATDAIADLTLVDGRA